MSGRTESHHEASKFVPYKDIGLRSGNLVIPDDEGPLHPSWLAPLDAVTRAAAGNPRFRFFDPSDFMIMNQWLRRGRVDSTSRTPGCSTPGSPTTPPE